MHVFGKHRGHHPVVVAVGDRGRLGELRQVRQGRSDPTVDRLQLRPERLHLDGRVPVYGAFLEPVDERACGKLTGGIAIEEQELLRIRAGQGAAEHVEVGDAGDLVDVLTAGGAGTREDQLADQPGVFDDEGLGDDAAEGEGENVDLAEPEGA